MCSVGNTGKLLMIALDGELLVMGVEEHERRFAPHLLQNLSAINRFPLKR